MGRNTFQNLLPFFPWAALSQQVVESLLIFGMTKSAGSSEEEKSAVITGTSKSNAD